MDKTLQTTAWNCLPKEFKEEVKSHYAGLNAAYQAFLSKDSLTNAECDRCKVMRENIALYNMYFGRHNLTSDAEGEEMLTVSRKKVQRRYHMAYKCKHSGLLSHDDVQFWKGWQGALDDLFGSKCLPDNVDSSKPNVDSLSSNVDSLEPKSAEPKLRRGSFAYHDNVKVRITKIKANGDVIAYTKDGYRLIGRECDFEPYTEPEDKKSGFLHGESVENLRIADEETHLRNLSQNIANCDKDFDNILKDSFAKERRLNIAAMIMAAMMQNAKWGDKYSHIATISRAAADALIIEVEKTNNP